MHLPVYLKLVRVSFGVAPNQRKLVGFAEQGFWELTLASRNFSQDPARWFDPSKTLKRQE